LEQIILGERKFKLVQMKGIAPLQGEIIAIQKYTEIFKKKSSSPEPAGQFNQT
jgi:hypothetical protein